jgi:hypothetical protein
VGSEGRRAVRHDRAEHPVQASTTRSGGRIWFVWIRAQGHLVDHAVTDEDASCSRHGWYRAVCGAVFLPAAMEAPPLPACAECGRLIRARLDASPGGQQDGSAKTGRHARAGWWSRTFGRGRRDGAG